LFALGVAILFLAVVCGLAARGTLPPGVAALYLAASLVAAIVYGIDKSSARSGAWRTPETSLHLLALMGGWPGALAAQRIFRHKSRKPSFQFMFWVTVVLNCGVLVWFWWNVR
jgi:uncharacterized membrane protein YsdA (DUF1294 family)